MPVNFRKKNRRMRGKTTHGWGTKKKHRGSGSHGGAGFAGSHKHKYSLITTSYPDYFGKKGFITLRKKSRVINIGDLAEHAGNDINLKEMGYDKLLSSGVIKKAVTVRIDSYSKRAKEKIEGAGGKIISKG